jgi:glycolate oxidase
MGGSITGEHGVGLEKRAYLPAMFSADEIDCFQRLRAAFDPLGIANPGKMFPGGDAPALTQQGLHPLERAGVASRE